MQGAVYCDYKLTLPNLRNNSQVYKLLALRANRTTTYSKTKYNALAPQQQHNIRLALKANQPDMTTALAIKGHPGTTYTVTHVDHALSPKPTASNVYGCDSNTCNSIRHDHILSHQGNPGHNIHEYG